jgi:HSP20 family molecular chaperone IbpA
VQLELPGWEPQEVTYHVLSTKGERKQASPLAQAVHLQEIADRRFLRVFKLPALVDSQQASAIQKNSLLTVTFPKGEEVKATHND